MLESTSAIMVNPVRPHDPPCAQPLPRRISYTTHCRTASRFPCHPKLFSIIFKSSQCTPSIVRSHSILTGQCWGRAPLYGRRRIRRRRTAWARERRPSPPATTPPTKRRTNHGLVKATQQGRSPSPSKDSPSTCDEVDISTFCLI